MEKQHDSKSWKTTEPLKFNINEPRIIRWSEFLWWRKKNKQAYTAKWSEQTLTELTAIRNLWAKAEYLSSHELVSLPPWYQYKFHDVAVEELQKIHRIFPGMTASTGTYSGLFLENTLGAHFCRCLSFAGNWLLLLSISAYSDSTQKDLMKLIGNLPVQYEGESAKVLACHVWDHYVLMIASLS